MDGTSGVWVNGLVVGVYVEEAWCEYAALQDTISLSVPSALLAVEVNVEATMYGSALVLSLLRILSVFHAFLLLCFISISSMGFSPNEPGSSLLV